jgi:hypothetical protein
MRGSMSFKEVDVAAAAGNKGDEFAFQVWVRRVRTCQSGDDVHLRACMPNTRFSYMIEKTFCSVPCTSSCCSEQKVLVHV